MTHAGEAAALATALLWAVGSLLFAWTSLRVGALGTNLFRITLAALLLGLARTAIAGQPFPFEAPMPTLATLAVSGFVGLSLGDFCYFRALVLMGPRRATLLFTTAPVMTAVLGWAALGERLEPRAILGLVLVVAGTAWVVVERSPAVAGSGWRGPGQGSTRSGMLFGLGAAAGQALGLVLSKDALRVVDPLSAAVVRMLAAALLSWAMAMGGAGIRRTLEALRSGRVVFMLVAATLVGPVAGMSLSLYAVRHTETAIAATLMALMPLMVIPIVAVVDGERPSLRAVVGAAVAVVGVGLLVSRPG